MPTNQTSKRATYGLRANGGAHGDVFTRHEVVAFMLDNVDYSSERDLSTVKILEPSCGEGEFVMEILHRLQLSANRFGFDFGKAARENVIACDNDAGKIARCKERIVTEGLGQPGIDKIFVCDDFLMTELPMVDVVVGNPPYVRYENIPKDKRAIYKATFRTFHYRPDLYVMFFEKSLRLLNPGGKHCLICANRWLKNEYGRRLRTMVARHFRLLQIINMENADAFQEVVLAYPAITLIEAALPRLEDICGVAEVEKVEELATARERMIEMEQPLDDNWSILFTDNYWEDSATIEELGFTIGIGVATGADSIFISPSLPQEVESELLLPSLSAKDLRHNTMQWNGNYLLNPYNENGTLIDLSLYPKAAAYLERHGERLRSRHVARRSPSAWYKTIDRIVPSLQHEAKILLPDMSGNSLVFVDEGNYYPQHNIYYIKGRTLDDLKALSAVLMSDSIRQQLASLTNRMNGGYPRWQSQYLRKLRLPLSCFKDRAIYSSLVSAYDSKTLSTINRAIKQTTQKRPIRKPRGRHCAYEQLLGFDFAV